MTHDVASLVVSITSVGDDLDRFCRKLSAAVNQSRMHLSSVIERGTQIYPVRPEAIGVRPMLLECEFRPRESGVVVSRDVAMDVLSRLSLFEVTGSHIVDDRGVTHSLHSHIKAAG